MIAALLLAASCGTTTGDDHRAASAEENRPTAENLLTPVTARTGEAARRSPPPLPEVRSAPDGECSFQTAMTGIEDSVFQVIFKTPDGPEYGTAFSVGDGDFLTAAHLLAGRTSARLRNARADFPATVTATDPSRDLALLRAAGPTESAGAGLKLADSAEVQPGEPVASVGYPLFEDYQPSIAGGLISRFATDSDLGLLVQTDAPINRGNSGGPLVDQCGRVVGMVVEKWFEEGVEGVGWAVASSSLKAALEDLRNGRTLTAQAMASQTVSPPPPSITPAPPPLGPTAFLDELAASWGDFNDRIDVAGSDFDAGRIDAAALERVLWQLAEGADDYRNALDSAEYDLGNFGRSCDLARRAYVRALGWTSRLAGFGAAQVRHPLEYHSEVIEARRKSRAIADEAAEHRAACPGDR